MSVYRDDSDGLRARYRELLDAHLSELDRIPRELWQVHARRRGRIAFGATLSASFLLLVVAPLAASLYAGAWVPSSPWSTCALVATWLGATLALVLARAGAAGKMRARIIAELGGAGDLHTAIARLEQQSPRRQVAAAIERMEQTSVAWPLTGIALVLPLSMHFVVAMVGSAGAAWSSFDEWIALSLVIVGHCHLVLVWRAWRLARDLRRADTLVVGEVARGAGWSAWCYTVCSSVVPGLAFIGIPVVLVAATGLLFIPGLFHGIGDCVARERMAVEAALAE